MKKIFTKAFMIAISVMCVSCATKHKAILGDAIRFSDEVETSYTHKDGKFKNLSHQSAPFELYKGGYENPEQVGKLKGFINRDHSGRNTAGYYALDLGLDRVSYVRRHQFKNDPNTKYYIIYMTDGLDNTSVQVARNHKDLWFINKEKAYVKHIQRKVKNAMGAFSLNQNTFKIFPIMFIGNDVQENMKKRGYNTIDEIKKGAADVMKGYRGASKGTVAPEVILGTDFNEITKDFEEMFASSGFEFLVPSGYRGKRIRMNLENEKGEKIQVEGKLTKEWFMWCLTDITYPKNVTLTDQRPLYRGKPLKKLFARNRKDLKAANAKFRLDDIKLDGKNYKVVAATQEYGKYYDVNTEFDALKRDNSDAYILLIMDESRSLGDQAKNERKAMSDIVDIIIQATNN